MNAVARNGRIPYHTDMDEPQGFEQMKGTDVPTEPVASKRPMVQWVVGISVVVLIGLSVATYAWFRWWSPISVSGDKIIVRDSAGGALEINTKPELPAAFPDDVPVHPDANLETSAVLLESDDPEQEGSVYLWVVSAPLEDVAFWYLPALEQDGWDVPIKNGSNNTVFITATKGERGFILTLHGVSSTRTEVSLVFSEEFAQ